MVEGFDAYSLGIELGFLRGVQEVVEAAVMVEVVVRRNHGVELDAVRAVVFEELSVPKVCGALARVLRPAWVAAVDHDVVEIWRLDQHAVALAHIDEVDLEERLAAF